VPHLLDVAHERADQDICMSESAHRARDHDHVDLVLAEWRKEQPRLDTSPIAVVARIGRARALLDRGLNANFARFGLNRTDWDILASLRRIGAPYRRSPTELYRALMCTSGGMTHLVDRLERDGLVERTAASRQAVWPALVAILDVASHDASKLLAANDQQLLADGDDHVQACWTTHR
jgi:MarR family